MQAPTNCVSLRAAAVCLALGLSAGVTAGQNCPTEPPLKNHNLITSAAVCPCFVTGEEMGAVFSVPASHYPIEILRVRFGWFSLFGGAGQSLEQAIHIYPAGLPNPGVPQFSLPAPQLTDGFINEFDISQVPGNKTINGGSFTVTLEFSSSQGIFDGAPASDNQGCIPGRNVVFAVPGGWTDACGLGISGQWLVEVVYRQTARPLCATPSTVSLSAGGSQAYTLLGGAGNASQLYWILGSATGTAPGFPVPPFTLPLNFDSYFLFTINSPNLLISNQVSFLNGSGQANAAFTIGAGTSPSLAGVTLNHAYFVYDLATSQVLMTSNAMPVTLVL